jgi:hypothetical protein
MASVKAEADEVSEIVATACLEAAESWLTLCRKLYFDLPLIWTMEISRFASHELEEQVRYCARLAGCTDLPGAMDEQARFARDSVAELGDEVQALVREAEIAVAA